MPYAATREATQPLLLTVPAAARMLAISESTLLRLMAAGKLPSVQLGKCRRIPMEALHQLAHEGQQPAQEGK
ncbi:MAG TPA: helix-turn-helix domain-containing protein [Chthonomonadaceae bacterium]|nr:helix-turn-helix domain-containing protein [Chthonomonadaceae bacterium]